MPLPLILGIGAAIAAVGGVGAGIHGGVKMKEAKDTMEGAQCRHEKNVKRFEEQNKQTTEVMDELGKLELEILQSFSTFADLIEKIHNRPEFKKINKDGTEIPTYSPEEIKKVSVGAGLLVGGLGGAAAGTAGGFAAAGVTTAAVMALGTASTGTAIATLSGAAATNATLAALGGGAIVAGGGGIALGTAVLGGATLGVGLLVGGIIFNFTGRKLSDKADEAWAQMKKAEKEIDKICEYLKELQNCAEGYKETLNKLNKIYDSQIKKMTTLIIDMEITDWNDMPRNGKLIVENTAYLVGVLYNMCKVQIVLQSENENEPNKINIEAINTAKSDADNFLNETGLAS